MICQYTRIIHSKGWIVKDACEHWGMRYDVWRRKCRNKNTNKAQLISMCRGLDNKSNNEYVPLKDIEPSDCAWKFKGEGE